MRTRSLLFGSLLFAATLFHANAQSLQITSQVGSGVVTQVSSGGAISVVADGVGFPASVAITLRNVSSNSLTVNQIALSGDSSFTLSAAVSLPLTIAAGGSSSFTIQYLPTSTRAALATVQIQTSEGSPAVAGSYSFQMIGATPDLAVSYTLGTDTTSQPLSAGGVLSFGATGLQSSLIATVTITNRGTGIGLLQSASVSPSPEFQLSGAPQSPITLNPGDFYRFQILFTPRVLGRTIGTLSLVLTGGRMFTSALDGLGGSPDLRVFYTLPTNQNVVQLIDGGQLSFPATSMGGTTTATISIQNMGSGVGTVNSVAVAGAGFELASAPAFPLSIDAGKSATFSVRFKPTAIGSYSGTLKVYLKDQTINVGLDGSTAPPDFYLSYTDSRSNNSAPLSDGSQITFQPTSINSVSSVKIVIENRGAGTGIVNAASISGTGFVLSGLPLLPLNLSAGNSVSFTIGFQPASSGSYSGTLKLDLKDRTVTVALSGSTATPDFNVSYQDASQNLLPLTDGGTLSFPAISLTATSTTTIYVENRGAGAGVLNSVVLTGNGFELVSLAPLPLTIDAGKAMTFGLRFRPNGNSTRYTGSLKLDFKDRSITVAVNASTAAPDFSLSYVDPALANAVPVSTGGVIPYPNTLTTAKNDILVIFGNRGTGGGVVSNITLSGDGAFQLLQLPILPYTVDASKDVRFSVRFSPTNRQLSTGQLQITLADQTVYTYRLEGTGIGSAFSYALVTTDATTPLLPDGNISFPDAELNQTSNMVLRISNTGTATGTLTTLLISGASFSVTDAPLPPVTVKPGDSIQLTLAFTPTQADAVNGRLRVGDDSFTLSGKGVGTKWAYSFTKGNATTTLDGNGVILLGSAAVGDQTSVQYTITNRGNKPGPIFSLILTGGTSSTGATLPFQMVGIPALPVNVDPGASLTFTIRFQPDNIGTAVANLVVNNVGFSLVGNGLAPQRLPKFNFTGASATQDPMQQPAMGLTLSDPYPLPLQGALTLDFVSDVFSGNPAVQFATGGRVVKFTIPANGTDATFENGAKTVRLQTGTVAGNILVTPAFATQAGLDVTPSSPTLYTTTINRSAPKILDAKITSRSAGGLVLAVTGYSTTRALKQLVLDLAPGADAKLSATHLTVDLQSASMLWYQSTASQAFGSLFTISLPITVQGNGSATEDRVAKLSSIAVSASNDIGASNAITVPIL